jgi:hypothetical protein
MPRQIGPGSRKEVRTARLDCPKPGDVVIAREVVDCGLWYVVRAFPGTPQLLCASREAALALVKAFAQRQRVEIWEGEGETYSRIDGD